MTGQELKSKILASGKTQKEIADVLGVTPQALTTIFKSQDVRSGTIEKIAMVLGVDMSFFYPSDNMNNQYFSKAKNVVQKGTINDGQDIVQELLKQNAALISLVESQIKK